MWLLKQTLSNNTSNRQASDRGFDLVSVNQESPKGKVTTLTIHCLVQCPLGPQPLDETVLKVGGPLVMTWTLLILWMCLGNNQHCLCKQ